MFRLLSFFVTILGFAAVVWLGITVELGDRTLFGHLRAIGGSSEAKQLWDGTRDKVTDLVGKDGIPGAGALKDKLTGGDKSEATPKDKGPAVERANVPASDRPKTPVKAPPKGVVIESHESASGKHLARAGAKGSIARPNGRETASK